MQRWGIHHAEGRRDCRNIHALGRAYDGVPHDSIGHDSRPGGPSCGVGHRLPDQCLVHSAELRQDADRQVRQRRPHLPMYRPERKAPLPIGQNCPLPQISPFAPDARNGTRGDEKEEGVMKEEIEKWDK